MPPNSSDIPAMVRSALADPADHVEATRIFKLALATSGSTQQWAVLAIYHMLKTRRLADEDIRESLDPGNAENLPGFARILLENASVLVPEIGLTALSATKNTHRYIETLSDGTSALTLEPPRTGGWREMLASLEA